MGELRSPGADKNACATRPLWLDHREQAAAGPEFVAFDLEGGLLPLAGKYPSRDVELYAAGVIQHGRPVYRQPHFLASLERLLGGEPHFAATDLECLACTHSEDAATLYALVANILLYGKPEPRALGLLPLKKLFIVAMGNHHSAVANTLGKDSMP